MAPQTGLLDGLHTRALLLHAPDRAARRITVAGHCATVAALLTAKDYEFTPELLRALTPQDIESFVRRSGSRLKRSSLQGMVAHVRTLLRLPVSDLDLGDLGPPAMLDFLHHLEADRHSVPAT
jgi:hypothetical protein